MSSKQTPPKILDKRLVDRFVSRGILKRVDVQKEIDALPDLTAHSEDIADRVYREPSGE